MFALLTKFRLQLLKISLLMNLPSILLMNCTVCIICVKPHLCNFSWPNVFNLSEKTPDKKKKTDIVVESSKIWQFSPETVHDCRNTFFEIKSSNSDKITKFPGIFWCRANELVLPLFGMTRHRLLWIQADDSHHSPQRSKLQNFIKKIWWNILLKDHTKLIRCFALYVQPGERNVIMKEKRKMYQKKW